ncbi:MAG: sulfotransferase [Pseudomonadota bacterium]
MTEGPTFIGVGPEKTGTTWVDYNLGKQPDFWLPPIKELRFFWEDMAVPGEGVIDRFFRGDEWHKQQYRAYLKKQTRSFLADPVPALTSARSRTLWDLSYLFRRHTDDWYLANFRHSNAPHRGEVSPQYFFLPEPQVQKIRSLLPDVKIIITLREPVAWCWSFCKMIERQGELQRDYGGVRDFFEQKARLNSFSDAASRWLHYFGEDAQVFFYEDLQLDGRKFLGSILNFLDVDERRRNFDGVTDSLNPGGSDQIPQELQFFAKSLFRDDVLRLEQVLGSLPSCWTA